MATLVKSSPSAGTNPASGAAGALVDQLATALKAGSEDPQLARALLQITYAAGATHAGAFDPAAVSAAAAACGDVQTAAMVLEARLMPARHSIPALQEQPAAVAPAGLPRVLRVTLGSPSKATQQLPAATQHDAGAGVTAEAASKMRKRTWRALAGLYGTLGDVDARIVAEGHFTGTHKTGMHTAHYHVVRGIVHRPAAADS